MRRPSGKAMALLVLAWLALALRGHAEAAPDRFDDTNFKPAFKLFLSDPAGAVAKHGKARHLCRPMPPAACACLDQLAPRMRDFCTSSAVWQPEPRAMLRVVVHAAGGWACQCAPDTLSRTRVHHGFFEEF